MQAATRPTPEQLQAFAEGFNASAMLRHFGVELFFSDAPSRVCARVVVRHEHVGGLGSAEAVNGGILAALFDLVLGCTPALIDPARRSATMQLSMSFLSPAVGPEIVAEAWVDRAGRSTVFASAHILNGEGDVCARAQGVVKFANIPWSNGRSPGAG